MMNSGRYEKLGLAPDIKTYDSDELRQLIKWGCASLVNVLKMFDCDPVITSGLFTVSGGYIIADKDYTIPFQWSDKYQLGKIPGGKEKDAGLIELLADAHHELSPYKKILQGLYDRQKSFSTTTLCRILGREEEIIDSIDSEVMMKWLWIVSQDMWSVADIKEFASNPQAQGLVAYWLKMNHKMVQDFIKRVKDYSQDDYCDDIEERELSYGSKKIRKQYYQLFDDASTESPEQAAVREYKEETGYKIDPKKLQLITIVDELKTTQHGNPYLKKRYIYRYTGELGQQGEIVYSESEKKQKLQLLQGKTIHHILSMLQGGLEYKLGGKTYKQLLKTMIGKLGKADYKSSSAFVTYVVMMDYYNRFVKTT